MEQAVEAVQSHRDGPLLSRLTILSEDWQAGYEQRKLR